MEPKAVNYDQLAPTYNHRFSGVERQPILIALQEIIQKNQAKTILEVGCGTGHWLAGIEELFAAQVGYKLLGLDLSAGMLQQARARNKAYSLVRGQAERLPFRQTSFDLIYCVHALHHFSRQYEFVAECLRWLKPGGILAIIGSDPHQNALNGQRGEWFVYEYFEGVLQTDLARFPSWGQVLNWMVGAGYESVSWQPIEVLHDSWQGAEVLTDPFLKQEATSQLALLSEPEYQAGLDRLKDAITAAQAAGVEIEFHSKIFIDMLLGRKSPG